VVAASVLAIRPCHPHVSEIIELDLEICGRRVQDSARQTERLGDMSTSQQSRTRAAEFGELIKTADHPDAIRELRRQERAFTELADNEDWLANNLGKTVHPADKDDSDDLVLAPTAKGGGDGPTLAEDEEQVLRRLGAAVIMRWNTLPTNLQRELFEAASSVGDLLQAGAVKGQIARFPHNHKDDDDAPKA
jgi:hypothetical protein